MIYGFCVRQLSIGNAAVDKNRRTTTADVILLSHSQACLLIRPSLSITYLAETTCEPNQVISTYRGGPLQRQPMPSHADSFPSHADPFPFHADSFPSHADSFPSHADSFRNTLSPRLAPPKQSIQSGTHYRHLRRKVKGRVPCTVTDIKYCSAVFFAWARTAHRQTDILPRNIL